MSARYLYPNIEAERVRHNLSQAELVEKLSVSRKSYYNWLFNGKIPATVLLDLANLFECSIDYLLDRTHSSAVTDRSANITERRTNP